MLAIIYPADMTRHDADPTQYQPRTNGDSTQAMQRLTVTEAAGAMGISAEAVRQRIKRGTLPTEKDPSGTVYVLLDDSLVADRTHKDADMSPDSTDLVESLQEQVAYLRETVAKRDEEIRRRDHLLAAALERIPAIEAPQDTSSETRESPLAPSEEPGRGTAPEQEQGEQRRSWWRAFFGLD